MTKKLQLYGTEDVARRWQALAQRRREHLTDLHDSGRWRKYYREHNFFTQLRETARITDAWDKVLAGASARA